MYRKLEFDDRQSFLETLGHLTDIGNFTDNMWRDFFEKVTENPYQRCIVIDIDGKVVGTAMAVIHPKFIHGGSFAGSVEDVAVHPDYRRRGIANGLIRELEKFFKEHRCYKVTLQCDFELSSLYKKSGFRQPKNDILMRKDF